ncbi:hypothetical protein O181_006175 [Austropuccinia psidii MF-1]|uniref:Uncharacterized protein n=1 Tax=Austropuccinia psidii MF-1 TaxID=1389203 RepID=A0A9Q3BJV2_9BASI|nr:hypothetical protein [Austropuccinia psidii MF-1]
MRRKLDMAIEDPENWIALELSGMNETHEGENQPKKCKMYPQMPQSNSPEIAEDYLNEFQEEDGSIGNIEKYVRNKETKDDTIRPLEKRKVKELEYENSEIIEDGIDQVEDRNMRKRMEQIMEKDPEEEKLVESKDDLSLYKTNNKNWEDTYKQGRIFEDLEEGELSESTQRIAGITIIEANRQEAHDAYEKICCFSNISLSSSTDFLNKSQESTARLTNDSQNQNDLQEDVPEYEVEEDYVIISMITFE